MCGRDNKQWFQYEHQLQSNKDKHFEFQALICMKVFLFWVEVVWITATPRDLINEG